MADAIERFIDVLRQAISARRKALMFSTVPAVCAKPWARSWLRLGEQKTSADRPKNTTRRRVRLQDYQCGLQSRWVAELRPLPGKNAVSEITGCERESHRSDRLVSVWLHVRASSGEEHSSRLDGNWIDL
jgi:hypothetical protein